MQIKQHTGYEGSERSAQCYETLEVDKPRPAWARREGFV
jgi:hypothetical protein